MDVSLTRRNLVDQVSRLILRHSNPIRFVMSQIHVTPNATPSGFVRILSDHHHQMPHRN